MERHEDWPIEDLARHCRSLDGKIAQLQKELNRTEAERNSLQFRVDHELEPLIKAKNRSYDLWATNPER